MECFLVTYICLWYNRIQDEKAVEVREKEQIEWVIWGYYVEI